ncbi:peptidylprolyl isomerase [Arenimonas sp. MALMAid1274]|uniref:peptidylprolyl isomerase n=1 Tax=Arenimonas sp. MALMAid1274 TaxID=3411630 RepID=UPI003B9E9EFB
MLLRCLLCLSLLLVSANADAQATATPAPPATAAPSPNPPAPAATPAPAPPASPGAPAADALPSPTTVAASPRVLVVTSLGEITLELDAAAAPRMVENFLAYARDGHFNGTIFHRVIPGLLVQAGAFTPDLQQKPTRAPVRSEAGNGLSNRRGTLAAARDRGVVDSATSQFFINLVDNPKLDASGTDSPYTAGYTVFGRVVLGLDVVDRIAAVPTSAQPPFPAWVPVTPVVIERVQVLPSVAAGSATLAPADEPAQP